MRVLAAPALVCGLLAAVTGAAASELELALERARQSRAAWSDLHFLIECRRDGPMAAVEGWGTGVGVWNRGRQFELPEEVIAGILEAFDVAGFTSMPETLGGLPEPTPHDDGHDDMAREVICLARLDLPGAEGVISKQVVQLRRGEQSRELKELSETVFRLCAESARSGLEIDSVTDGLARIGTGELASEVLSILVQRRLEGAGPDGAGFVLRLDGRHASSRTLEGADAARRERSATLAPERLARLAAALAAAAPDDLPANLYATHYTDVTIELLDQRVSLQARRFSGLTPTSLGESQRRFDALYELLARLQEQIQAS